MKKLFGPLLSVAMAFALQSTALSQISLTDGDLANYFGVGKSWFVYQSSDTVMMNVGSASSSSSQTWTPPSVNFYDTLRVDNVLPSSTPYSAAFSGATHAQAGTVVDSPITFTTYAYYKLSNDSLYVLGSVQHETGSFNNVKIDTTIVIHRLQLSFVLPINVGKILSTSSDTIYASGNEVEVNSSTKNYDAYGTITFPLGIGSLAALRVSDAVLTKFYFNGSLNDTLRSYTISWLTESGNQLQVNVDAPSSGTVKVYSVTFTRIGTTPATIVRPLGQAPINFMLGQNYPNPFNPSTQIQFAVPHAGPVSLKVYDVLGREVATLVDQELAASSYSVTWNAGSAASGVYFYRLVARSYSETKRMVLMK
ncbi:MAG TPA: T9SS type A sorting domain-containing protein [Bacteroidota bacterium]|nr:T9SS type A sorting domain-containing protein [Bacteroidota bacterium]